MKRKIGFIEINHDSRCSVSGQEDSSGKLKRPIALWNIAGRTAVIPVTLSAALGIVGLNLGLYVAEHISKYELEQEKIKWRAEVLEKRIEEQMQRIENQIKAIEKLELQRDQLLQLRVQKVEVVMISKGELRP